MKNWKHYDNGSMSIQIKFNKEDCDSADTDVNGNDNKFVSPESETSQCHGQITSQENLLSENQPFENNVHIKRQDARKLPPLRISKARFSSVPETNKDNNITSSPYHHLKASKSAKDQNNFKTDDKCKNIFSDFSMSHFSEMRHARTDISVKIGANKQREAKDKQLQKYPKLQVSLTLNDNKPETDLLSITENGIVHSVTHDTVNGNPQSLSICVCEYDTTDDSSELKSKSQNVKLTDSDNFLCNCSKEDDQHAGSLIPQLSPISFHRGDSSMLPSPLYSSQPPVLTPISEEFTTITEDQKKWFTVKTETDTQELSTVGASKQKSSSSLTPVHISAIKKTLKRTTCHALESICAEKIMCDFKDKNALLQRPNEILPNEGEQNVSEAFKRQNLHMKSLDNAVENIAIHTKANPKELLALSIKNKVTTRTRNKHHVRDGNTVRNAIESNICSVNHKVRKRNSKNKDKTEIGVKLFNGSGDANNQFGVKTESLASVDQTLMHSKVEISSRQSELILPSQDLKLTSNINSCSADHTVAESSIECQCVETSAASSTNIDNQNSSTGQEHACYVQCVENPEIKQLSSLKSVSPIHTATHKRERDKLSLVINSLPSNGDLQPCLMDQDSESYYSVLPTPEQSIPVSSSCSDVVGGLKTDIMRSVPYENTTGSLEHGIQPTETLCMKEVFTPSQSCVVTLEGGSEQPFQSTLNPLPIVNTQMCTAFEKDLFLDMNIQDDKPVSSATPGDSPVNPLQQESSSDFHTHDATKRQSSEYDCDGSLKALRDGLCSEGHEISSTFQSKYIEAINRDFKHHRETLFSPQLYKTADTTGIADLSPHASTVNMLSVGADRISPGDESQATLSSTDAFNSTVRTQPSQRAMARASSADAARHFRVSASNEATLRSLPATATTVIASSSDALASQTRSSTSHLFPQKVNIPNSSISRTSTKLDPDAVKNMSLHIIHHSGKRKICLPNETTQEANQLSSAYSAQPTSITMTPHVAGVNNTSQNVHKSKRNSVISVANSYLGRAQPSQLHVPSSEGIQTSTHFPHQESVPTRLSYRNHQPAWQPVKMDFGKTIETAKHAHSEHVLTQLKSDHMLAKSASLSPSNRENPGLPHVTSSSFMNYHTASSGFNHSPTVSYVTSSSSTNYHTASSGFNHSPTVSYVTSSSSTNYHTASSGFNHSPTVSYVTSSSSTNYHTASSDISNSPTVPYTQQLLRSEDQRVPFELTSDSKPHESLASNNESIHIPGSDMANQDKCYLRTSELIKSADYSPLVQGRSDKEEGIGKLSSDLLDQDRSSQEKLNEVEDSAQTSEFSIEPLDLSLPKEKKHAEMPADLSSKHLHSEVEMFAPSVVTSMCQPNMSDSEYITVSPDVTIHMPASSTSCEVVSSIQTPCQNKDVFAVGNRSLTLPQNCLVNALPTTVSSTRLQGIYHRSPLLETALLHNIVPKDIDPHPFNSVVPECLITRPSPSDQRECKRLTNKQTDYKKSHLYVSQSASLEPSSSLTAINSALPFDCHTSLVSSATVISPPVSQCSQSALSLLSNTEAMKHMGYNSSIKSGQHISAASTFQEKHTSSFTTHQQRANLPSQYTRTVSTSSYPSNSVIVTMGQGAVTSKVVPLPIEDFFTRTPKENTYSALLMAKITNKNKQNSGFQKVTELLRSCESQNSAHRNALEIGNHLQKNLVIDLTDSDDDCKLLPLCPQEYPGKDSAAKHLQVNSNDHDSLPVLKIVDSHASRITSPLKENTGDLHSVDHSICVGDVSKLENNQKDKVYLQNTPFINTSNNNPTGVPDYITDVENIEPRHNQGKHITDKNESCYENISITEGGVHTKIFSTSIIFRNDKPTVSTHPNADYSNSYTINDNVDKTLTTINSRTFNSSALDLKLDLPGKELMAKKLRSAMSMRILPEELTQTTLPLTSVYKEGAYVGIRQSPVRGFEERIQASTGISVHDNSTQRAAATLLELSANPIYNPYMISPESSGDFQEKVYQIHPFLSDHENNTWDTTQDGENNSLGFKSNHSYNGTGTKAHKSRSYRRVGRPPKDQYSTSNSDTLVTAKSISSNLVTPVSVENNTSLLTQAAVSDTKLVHSVTPYSFSNVIVRPPNMAYEIQTPNGSVRSDSLPYMFSYNYELPDQSQFVRDMQDRTMIAMGNQPLKGDHVSKSHNENALENSRHTTNNSPQFKGSMFARVASKTASDTVVSGTAIQTMTVHTGTHLSNGLQVVHNNITHTFHTNSPTTNISDLESIVRSQCESRCSVTNQQSPNPFVENSLPPASLDCELIVNNNAAFAEAKKCTSDPGNKHSRAQKRKYPNHNSQDEETAQSHTMPSETVPNVGFPLSCLSDTLMPDEDLTKQENTLSKSSKKKRTSQGRVKKGKKKKRNKNSKVLHYQNSNEQGTNVNNRNPQDNEIPMCQAKKDTKCEEVNFQDDEQTIQYGMQDLQMTEDSETGIQKSSVPVSSTSDGLTQSDRQLWHTSVASDGMSNMEKMEHQKEMEVTSLLALMMCNKYKGQV